MNKVIILQGAPNTGKDTVAEALCKAIEASHRAFKDTLYKDTDKFFNCLEGTTKALNEDRSNKDSIQEEHYALTSRNYVKLLRYLNINANLTQDIYPLTVRQALIYVAEIVIKPEFGSGHYGRLAVENMPSCHLVISDGGFNNEVIAVAEEVGYDNVYVVQLTRKGCSYSGDSRSFSNIPEDIAVLKCTNDGTVDSTVEIIVRWLEKESEGIIKDII